MDPAERREVFYSRMRAARRAANYRDARRLLSDILNKVEDEYSGVPYNADVYVRDGRMYPPHDIFRLTAEDSDIVVFHTRGHTISFYQSGRIIIEVRRGESSGTIVLDKSGQGDD